MVNSDVFRAMFNHTNTKECQESRILIQDSTPTAVSQMLIYLYTDELPKEYAIETDAFPLLYIANKYQIKSLVQIIEWRLIARFASKLGFQTIAARHLLRISPFSNKSPNN
jgi:hypothetical protein